METKHKRLVRDLQDILVLLVLGGLLYYGDAWQMSFWGSDPAHYQCYAVAFWQGWSGLQKLPSRQCRFLVNPDKEATLISQDELRHAMQQWKLPSGLRRFVAAQSSDRPYHSLPLEYPSLMLLPFSLGLIVPMHWYQVAFALEMFMLVGCVYLVLQRWRSRQAAHAYALYLVIGGLSTTVARIDIIPAGLTLFALICAVQKHWNWAFALLALATVSKVYPVILLVPFVLALQQATPGKWYRWHKWLPMILFVGICVLVATGSLLLSVIGTLAPLGYFVHRPVEAESLSGSLLWLCSLLGKTSLTYVKTFDSLNVLSPLSGSVTLLLTVLLGVGLLSTWWLQWRKQVDLAMACLLTLLLVIITGKVFSPQYLLWVFPLVVYVEHTNRWWLLFWIVVGYLTTWVYPYTYRLTNDLLLVPSLPLFYPLTLVRNFLLLGLIIGLLIWRSGLGHRLCHGKGQAESRKPSEENL